MPADLPNIQGWTIDRLDALIAAAQAEKARQAAEANKPKTGKVTFTTNGGQKPISVTPGNIVAAGGMTLDLPAGIEHTATRLKIPDGYAPEVPGGVKFTPVAGQTINARVLTVQAAVPKPPAPAQPPAPGPVTTRAIESATVGYVASTKPLPARTPLKLTKAFKIVGKMTIENYDIDAADVSRVFDLFDGCDLTVRNCTIKNAHSVIEKDVQARVRLEDVHCEETEAYGVYLGAGKIFDHVVTWVTMVNCSFASSRLQTPIRLMPGVEGDLENVLAYDTKDVGADKNEQGARFHNNVIRARRCTFGKWTRCHPTSDGKNNPNERMDLAEFDHCLFDGGLLIGKGIAVMRLVECKSDATKNDTGWALSKTRDGITKEITLDFRAEGGTYIGKVERGLGKFVGCVDGAGKPV